MTPEWYYAKNKKKYGPVTLDRLRQLASWGTIQPTDMVLRVGASTWAKAESVEAVFLPVATAIDPPASTPSQSASVWLFLLFGGVAIGVLAVCSVVALLIWGPGVGSAP